MKSLTSTINVRVDKKDKEQAKIILKELGLNMTIAINMFIKQIIIENGIPFKVENPKPSKELLEALQEGEDILSGKIKTKSYNNVYELLEDLKK